MREELQDAFTGELQRELHDVMEDSNDRKYDEWVFTRKLDQALLPPPFSPPLPLSLLLSLSLPPLLPPPRALPRRFGSWVLATPEIQQKCS